MAFSYDYQNKANVPIAKCATTYTCPIRDTPLFWLQTRSCGSVWTCIVLSSTPIRSAPTATALLCDDPWDSNRELGLDVGDFFIPFLASGPKSKPLLQNCDWELSNLLIIELTAPIWNPSTFTMPANLSNLSSHRSVHSMLASTLSESASLLGNISTSLDPRLVYSLYASAITIPSATTGTDVASRLSAYDFPLRCP